MIDDPHGVLPKAGSTDDVTLSATGKVASIDALEFGLAGLDLGAGRQRKDDVVDPAVGIEILRHVGDEVRAGEPVARLHHNGRGVEEARRRVARAYSLAEEVTPPTTRILEVLR